MRLKRKRIGLPLKFNYILYFSLLINNETVMCSFNVNTGRLFVQQDRIKFIVKCKKKVYHNSRKFSYANIVTENGKLAMPECPRPSFMQSLISLVSHDKALNLHELVNKKHKEFGPVYKDHIGPTTAIFVNSPNEYRRIFKLEGDMPKHFIPEAWMVYNNMNKCPRGLLFMDGEEWLHFRRIMNRLLLVPNLASSVYINSCQKAAFTLAKKWKHNVKDSWIVDDLERHLYQWSVEVMIATLLGSAWENYKLVEIHQENIAKLASTLHKIFELSAKLSVLPIKYVKKFKLPVWQEFVNTFDNAFEIIRCLILGMKCLKGDGLINLMKKEGLQERDVDRLITDLILAAGDTTAFSTLWALYLIATHPQIQENVAKKVSNTKSNAIIHDSYIRGIIKESLRLYPTAPFITRILPEDSTIANYPVAKGELILLSLYSSGRDERNFAQPDKFSPDRWIRNEKGHYDNVFNAFASIPFAMGARSCVGKKLAEAQMIFTLSELIKNFEIECLNADKIKMKLHLIAVPSEPIQLKLNLRNKI